MTGSVAPKRVVPTLTEVVEPADLAFLLDLDLDLPPRPRARAAEAGVAESPQLAAVPELPELTLAVDSVPDLSDPLEGEFLRPLAQELPAALDLTLPELTVAEQSAAPFNLLESSEAAPYTAPDTPDLDLAFDLAGPEVPAPSLESALDHPALTPTPVLPQALAPVLPLPASAPSTPAEPLRAAFAGQEQAIKEAIALAVDEALDQVLDEVLEQAVMTMRAQLHAHVESAVWRSLKRQLPQG
ncbi:MAG: hypothetical protein K2W93_17710 [Burkholderiaceae bacterium]|nr:hypothetical protein [Burkholderiaceae bacterium]